MSLTELLGHVGLFGGAVMVCLALLSVFSVSMIVDKQRRFRSGMHVQLRENTVEIIPRRLCRQAERHGYFFVGLAFSDLRQNTPLLSRG